MLENIDKGPASRLGKHVRTRLMSGVFVLIPLAITLFVLNVLFSSLTVFVRPILQPWVGELPEYALTLIALAATTAGVYLVGLVTTHIVGRRLIHWGEALLMRLPIVKTVYSASKQVVDTFSPPEKASFQAVVFVEFPRRGSLAVGFVTGTMRTPENALLYRVFIATTPNPTSGFLLLLPSEDVQFTDISIEDGIKMAISGGMLAPVSYQIISQAARQPDGP